MGQNGHGGNQTFILEKEKWSKGYLEEVEGFGYGGKWTFIREGMDWGEIVKVGKMDVTQLVKVRMARGFH